MAEWLPAKRTVPLAALGCLTFSLVSARRTVPLAGLGWLWLDRQNTVVAFDKDQDLFFHSRFGVDINKAALSIFVHAF